MLEIPAECKLDFGRRVSFRAWRIIKRQERAVATWAKAVDADIEPAVKGGNPPFYLAKS